MEEIIRKNRELIYHGSIIDYYKDTVLIPNGNTAKWDFIMHKGAAAVIPVTDDGKILMVKQYRNALDRYTIEIPAGGLNTVDEPTFDAAKRELEEETGYCSKDLTFLISTAPAVAYSSEIIDIYVAKNLRKTAQHLDEDEFIDVIPMSVDEISKMIFEGTIQDSKTIAAIMAYAFQMTK